MGPERQERAQPVPASAGPVLEARDLGKSFGHTVALSEVSIRLRPGEVHALLGENGAGKSTLMKILAGVLAADSGEIGLDGQLYRPGSVTEAVAKGIVPVHQRLSLLPHLSIAENLFAFELADGAGWRRSRIRDGERRAADALAAVGLDLDPGQPVSRLSLAQRQLVEIARAVARDCRVLLLDEPTSSLSGDEIEPLFEAIDRIRAEGRTIVFINHRMDEVERVADRVTVLRDGRVVISEAEIGSVSRDQLIKAMVGGELATGRSITRQIGDVALEVRGLKAKRVFGPIGFEIRAGEVLAVAGLIGAGSVALGEAIAGARPAQGEARLSGRVLPLGNRVKCRRAGVAFVPADRDTEAIFPTLDVRKNASASTLESIGSHARLDLAREREMVDPWLSRLAVKPADPEAPILSLSGGNQQKVTVVRSLCDQEARLLVAIEPTRGVDVGARQDIHDAIVGAAARGLAVLLITSDILEAVTLADRLLAMRAGEIVAEFDGEADTAVVLSHLTGAS